MISKLKVECGTSNLQKIITMQEDLVESKV